MSRIEGSKNYGDYNSSHEEHAHALEINPLVNQTLTPTQLTEINQNITDREMDLDKQLSSSLVSGRYNKLDEPVLDLIKNVDKLQRFHLEADENYRSVIDKIKLEGVFDYLKDCIDKGVDPLLSIALAVSEKSGVQKNQKITSLEYQESESDVILRSVLNQISIISAKELGLISPKEAGLLCSMKFHNQLSNRVERLQTALKLAVEKISEADHITQTKDKHPTMLEVKNSNQRMEELLAGNDFNRFRHKFKTLAGEIELSKPLEFSL